MLLAFEECLVGEGAVEVGDSQVAAFGCEAWAE